MAKKTIRAQCLEAAQLLARISAADENGYCRCCTCSTVHHYKEMDGGHFISKGSSSFWSLEPENIHPQCKGCNGFGMKYGNAEAVYTLYMVDMYGREFVDNMIASKKNTKKMYKKDYEDFLNEAEELIAYHKKRLGE